MLVIAFQGYSSSRSELWAALSFWVKGHMTSDELKIEHRYIVQERLGILDVSDPPPAWAHNMAVVEADAHIAAIRKQTETDTIRRLRELGESL